MKFRSYIYKTINFDVIKCIISLRVGEIGKAKDLSASLRVFVLIIFADSGYSGCSQLQILESATYTSKKLMEITFPFYPLVRFCTI
jgi:hypothetical protein